MTFVALNGAELSKSPRGIRQTKYLFSLQFNLDFHCFVLGLNKPFRYFLCVLFKAAIPCISVGEYDNERVIKIDPYLYEEVIILG